MVRVLCILSRDYARAPDVGRTAIVSRWMAVLQKAHDVTTFVPQMASELGTAALLRTLVTRSVLGNAALQVALYDTPANAGRLAALIRESWPDIIYVDGGRVVPLVRRALAQGGLHRDDFRIVVDTDDLMFRRYRIYKRQGVGLEMGVLGEKLKVYTKFAGSTVSDWLLTLEAGRMCTCEQDVAQFADDMVFSSDYERRLLSRLMGHRHRARMHRNIIGYTFDPVTPKLDPDKLVFGYIGGDKLVQNRSSIENLVRIWKDNAIPHDLVFIGRCHRTYDHGPNVTFTGFVEKLADWYERLDALVVFSYVRGGLKTKIPEGLSYGLPVIVNKIAVEGVFGLEDYSLAFDEAGLVHFLRQEPATIRSQLARERSRAPELVREHWSDAALEAFLAQLFSVPDAAGRDAGVPRPGMAALAGPA